VSVDEQKNLRSQTKQEAGQVQWIIVCNR